MPGLPTVAARVYTADVTESTMALRDENLTRCGFPYFPVLAPADWGRGAPYPQ